MGFFSFSRKPNVAPPSGLPDPDLSALDTIIEKYEPLLNKMIDDPFGTIPEWGKIKKALMM